MSWPPSSLEWHLGEDRRERSGAQQPTQLEARLATLRTHLYWRAHGQLERPATEPEVRREPCHTPRRWGHIIRFFAAATSSDVDDENATLSFVIRAFGLSGRLMNLYRELQTWLLRVCFSPLSLFAAANLLDDERG